MRFWILSLIMMVLVTSCAAFEDPSQRATENAENTALARTIAVVDVQIETMVALQATADSAALLSSQVTQIAGERDALRATLNIGVPGANSGGFSPTSAPAPGSTPSALDGGAPAGPLPSPTTASGVQYVQATTSTTLLDNSCAANPQEMFRSDTEVIYFVVTVENLSAGTSFSLRISEEGQIRNLDTNFWTSDGFYDRTCIWYGIDSANIPFEPGNFTAELLADNRSVAQTSFTIQ